MGYPPTASAEGAEPPLGISGQRWVAAGVQRNILWDFKIDETGVFQKPGGGAGYDETISD